jgi:hypothetical protein
MSEAATKLNDRERSWGKRWPIVVILCTLAATIRREFGDSAISTWSCLNLNSLSVRSPRTSMISALDMPGTQNNAEITSEVRRARRVEIKTPVRIYNACISLMLMVRAISPAAFALFLFTSANNCFAQQTFEINSTSAVYNLKVELDSCDEERKRLSPSVCTGPGQVSIYRKGSAAPFQTLTLKNLEVYKEQIAFKSRTDKRKRKLYDDEYSFIFGDFNFDANEDLAICNGRNGGYGGPSYNVYLYNVESKQFVESVNLSKLTEGSYLGLFFVKPKQRQLVAYSKSGCCYHESEIYRVIRNQPVMVEKIIEEASGSDAEGYFVVITRRKLVNGKWTKRVSKTRLK